jgi:cholesterol oxidase
LLDFNSQKNRNITDSASLDYDFIIIGSGFGGSVCALRLSEKGYKVLVIEKGKWFKAEDFPKTNWNFRKWLWIPFLRFFGIMKITIFRHAAVLSGTGVGGGSLVYGNTLPIPKSFFFRSGSWKDLLDWETELNPHYNTALKMLGATTNPRLGDGDLALQELSRQMGIEDEFSPTNVGVYFGEAGKTQKDPYFNGDGPDRTGCIQCGACMTGCRHNAKNTLDKNYLYLAQKKGATIMAENEVCDVRPLNGSDGSTGYELTHKSSTRLLKNRKNLRTRGVIFSGGVLGTVKLLLKLKNGALPNISDRIGDDVRTNNETLVSVSSLDQKKNFSEGIAIGSILRTDAHTNLEICRYGEGSNAWKLTHLPNVTGANGVIRLVKTAGIFLRNPLPYFQVYLKNPWSRSSVVLLFMQTLDSTLKIHRNMLGGLGSSMSSGKKPTPFIPESLELTKGYSRVVNGKSTSFVLETVAGIPSTAHILGGAVMGRDPSQGVIDSSNQVFGYKNMMVVDGSMISANPGVNPALTITAIAERAMVMIPPKDQI